MNKHTAICPNGQIVKRNSKTRRYTHVAVVNYGDGWKVLGWTSAEQNAHKSVSQDKAYVQRVKAMDLWVKGEPEWAVLPAIVA